MKGCESYVELVKCEGGIEFKYVVFCGWVIKVFYIM